MTGVRPVLLATVLAGIATYTLTKSRVRDRGRSDGVRVTMRHESGTERHYDIDVRGRVTGVTPTCECVHVSNTAVPAWTEEGETWSRFRVVLETDRSNGNSGLLIRLESAQPLLVTLD